MQNAEQVVSDDAAQIERLKTGYQQILRELRKVIIAQDAVVEQVIISLLVGGHSMITGVPGLAKTLLIKTIARVLDLRFKRIQFTPDLMPADITGTDIIQEDVSTGRRELVFVKGPIFANILLADEINRTPPKTQAALLEAMEEVQVTVQGVTYPMDRPFFVLATQNPIELEGTYPLPEAQLDRFMFKVDVAGVDRAVLEEILTTRVHGEPPALTPVLDAAALQRLFDAVDAVHMPRAVANYTARLVVATHPDSADAPPPVRQFVRYGSSPRGAIAIGAAARGLALMRGKPNVGFDEIRRVAPAALSHRLVLDYSARLEGWTGRRLLAALLEAVPDVERGLPQTLEART